MVAHVALIISIVVSPFFFLLVLPRQSGAGSEKQRHDFSAENVRHRCSSSVRRTIVPTTLMKRLGNLPTSARTVIKLWLLTERNLPAEIARAQRPGARTPRWGPHPTNVAVVVEPPPQPNAAPHLPRQHAAERARQPLVEPAAPVAVAQPRAQRVVRSGQARLAKAGENVSRKELRSAFQSAKAWSAQAPAE
jgi:hypothetical protein